MSHIVRHSLFSLLLAATGLCHAAGTPPGSSCAHPISQRDALQSAQAIVNATARGGCARVTSGGVAVDINGDARLFDEQRRVPGIDDRDYYRLPLADVFGRVVRLKDDGIVLVRSGRLPWRQARRSEFLRRYAATLPAAEQAALRARIAAEQARGDDGEPVCLDEHGRYAGSLCSPENIVMERNPDYWSGAGRDRIELLVVSTATPGPSESQEQQALRMSVFHQVDVDRLLSMVAR